jgi:DNA-binding CsgD family transcriptional regulator
VIAHDDLVRIEAKIDALFMLLGGTRGEAQPTHVMGLPRMTTKQHAALQMLLRGAGNHEIAERFGVTINTAKVYVRGLFAKFEVNTRAGIVLAAKPLFDATDPEDYIRQSGGLPKT